MGKPIHIIYICEKCNTTEADWDQYYQRFCRRCLKKLCYECSFVTNSDRVFCHNETCIPQRGDPDYDKYDE